MTTIGESISRISNVLKATNEDSFLTRRQIYSVITKYLNMIVRRQDNEYKIFSMKSLFKTMTYVELIEVDKIQASCTGIKSGCKIMRTKDKLPEMVEGTLGPLIKNVLSIDGSDKVYPTNSYTYVRMSNSKNFKYNKKKYYWYSEGYLYFPNVEWEAVMVEAAFNENIEKYNCNDNASCLSALDREVPLPDYLFAEVEQLTLKELMTGGSIPADNSDDSQAILR